MGTLRGDLSTVGAIIVAAGESTRMGQRDKILAPLAGKPLLAIVIETFHQCPVIDQIVVVLSEKNLEAGRRLAKERQWNKVRQLCLGGLRRQDSVKAGLDYLSDCGWVVIHDGARPCVTMELIERGLVEARYTGAAIAAIPVKETIKVVDKKLIVRETPLRQDLWVAQTPQVFRFDIIKEAHRQISEEATDDAMLVEKLGHKVKVYPGSYENIKVTTPEDLILADAILKARVLAKG